MSWTILRTEEEYEKAIVRTLSIFHAAEGSREAEELALLLLLVSDYESKHIVIPEIGLIDIIKIKMAERGLKAKDLESIIGTKGHVSSILSGRRDITLKMAQRLKDYFQLPAEIFLPSVPGVNQR
jgi:HTH-type transcriptional regulator/antitoxin HigA